MLHIKTSCNYFGGIHIYSFLMGWQITKSSVLIIIPIACSKCRITINTASQWNSGILPFPKYKFSSILKNIGRFFYHFQIFFLILYLRIISQRIKTLVSDFTVFMIISINDIGNYTCYLIKLCHIPWEIRSHYTIVPFIIK